MSAGTDTPAEARTHVQSLIQRSQSSYKYECVTKFLAVDLPKSSNSTLKHTRSYTLYLNTLKYTNGLGMDSVTYSNV